jgi:hypothetical protein
MTKFVTAVMVVVLGLVAVGAVGPSIAAVFNALIPLVLVIGVLAVVLRIVWWRTRGW